MQAGVCDSFLFLASCVKIQFVFSHTAKCFRCFQNKKAKGNKPGRFRADSWQLSVQINIHAKAMYRREDAPSVCTVRPTSAAVRELYSSPGSSLEQVLDLRQRSPFRRVSSLLINKLPLILIRANIVRQVVH
jgi:hypothetical protein